MNATAKMRLALGLLMAIFALRVLAQLVVSFVEIPLLPAFESWHSDTFDYPVLLSSQAVILVCMALAIRHIGEGKGYPRAGRLLCRLGAIYAAVMITRTLIGAGGLMDHAWFHAPIPTAFHFVLAGFVWILGAGWSNPGEAGDRPGRLGKVIPWLAYPLTISGALLIFGWLKASGAPTMFAAYLPVTLGAAAIVVHELLLPYRNSWVPKRGDLLADGLYLTLVQMALPALLSAVAVGLVLHLSGSGIFAPANLWPHRWPVALQTLLMILGADFLRYWLHRAAHRFNILWRLHAVHHAPDHLYIFNVARFHPFEKALQFGVEVFPFILMGVTQEVTAAYFVFYALNGFYQHSNAMLHLGILNWIVAGPELHRWHHAREPKVSNHNFGNNLIVWDNCFGTRLLPKLEEVGGLGLRNPRYPRGFLAQTLAPVLVNPNEG
jgi:sterol desaturase/sphingolipid hydroxylase (fatty acid hydroxylase superfamily)